MKRTRTFAVSSTSHRDADARDFFRKHTTRGVHVAGWCNVFLLSKYTRARSKHIFPQKTLQEYESMQEFPQISLESFHI